MENSERPELAYRLTLNGFNDYLGIQEDICISAELAGEVLRVLEQADTSAKLHTKFMDFCEETGTYVRPSEEDLKVRIEMDDSA